jgi:hypothetical protein
MFKSEFNKDFWCGSINLFFEDCEAKSESRKEDIERSKVAGSNDEH